MGWRRVLLRCNDCGGNGIEGERQDDEELHDGKGGCRVVVF